MRRSPTESSRGRQRAAGWLSLRTRLAAVIFAITLVAIAALYVYVAPGLQTRLVTEKRSELAASARTYSGRIVQTVGSDLPLSVVRARVDAAGLASGDRVTLLLVLGLAIASELAERMCGRLSVTSMPGETAFTLELPASGRGSGTHTATAPASVPRVPV
jgi:hypothetical protein